MLSPELDLADLDARHWRGWWRLLVPPRVLDDPRWALAVVEGAPPRPVVVTIAGRGPVEPTPALPGLDEPSLARWARALGVEAVVVLDRGVIAEVAREIEGALRLDQDPVEQALVALRAVKRRAGRGIWSAPALLELVPAPAFDGLQRTFDLLVPDDSAMFAYVIDDDRRAVHASIIAVKRRGSIVRAATHRAIAREVPEAALAAAWETAYPRVVDAVAARFARPSVGVFVERAAVMRIVTGPADQLARELDAGRLVIDPAPAWLSGLLGGAAAMAVATRGARALAAMLPAAARERAADLAHRAQAAFKESGAHPFALLGFDPLELWHRLRGFYRDDRR